jgi:hypothetical protein
MSGGLDRCCPPTWTRWKRSRPITGSAGQLTGPWTLAAAIELRNGEKALSDSAQCAT